jgi:hypothetical protein
VGSAVVHGERALSLRERVAEGRVRARKQTLIRPSATFSQREKALSSRFIPNSSIGLK